MLCFEEDLNVFFCFFFSLISFGLHFLIHYTSDVSVIVVCCKVCNQSKYKAALENVLSSVQTRTGANSYSESSCRPCIVFGSLQTWCLFKVSEGASRINDK